LFLLSNQVTLLLMILMIKVSLRAKRGNPIRRNIFISMGLLHSARNDTDMRLPRFARNDIQKILPNY